VKKLAILTGGGDCPGLNAVIRAAVKTILPHGWQAIGLVNGFSGLVEGNYRELDGTAISGILHRGGTILGTNNRDNPFEYPVKDGNGVIQYIDRSDEALANMERLGITCLLAIGGDGTLAIARDLAKKGANVVGVPKTIDNDLAATDKTFGFDTAVDVATDALDRLHTTAESHHRVMVLELMGRYAGWISLVSGMAGGADVILIPEIDWQLENVKETILKRKAAGKAFSLVVVAEGAKASGGDMVVKERIEGSSDPIRLGGIGAYVGKLIEEATGMETRVTTLGHIQRGGSPIPSDRLLATRYGVAGATLALNGQYGKMAALQGDKITAVTLEEATHRLKTVDPAGELVQSAKAIGISFGD